MKQTLLLLFVLVFSTSLSAQYPGAGKWKKKEKSIKGKITGKVLDPQKKPIGYATVVLTDTKTDKQVNGNITDEKGKFKIKDVPTGSYKVSISFLGYLTKEILDVNLTLAKPDFSLGTISLEQDNVTLSEVEVVEEAPLVETKIDKIVYNADKDVTNAGGDASDVLRKVPMLAVDIEGNVSLRGSQNLQILINGKPSGMFANGTADALKMIPADQIKSVEVITSPSAKYDGEGSGGIINIITQKKQVQGYNVSVNGSLGTRQNNGNIGINAAKGRLGVNANAGFWHSWPNDGNLSFIREDYDVNADDDDQLISSYKQSGVTTTSRTGFFGNGGLNYDINAYHNISSSINFRGFSFNTESSNPTEFSPDVNQSFLEETTRDSDGKTLRGGFDWSTDYRRTFKEEGREFTAAFQLNGNVSTLDSDIISTSNTSDLDFIERQENDGDNKEYTGQIDYVHPFGKKVKLEIGAKSVIRRINSDYKFEQLDMDKTEYIADPFRTDIFDYKQDVYAGYTSFTFNLPKDIGIIAGVRYEHTSIGGEFASDNIDPFDNSYDNWLPSVIISKKTNMFSSVKLSYNQRIQRPSLFYINPYRNDIDRRNVSQGNPELEPELVHQVELGYNTFIKGLVLSSSIFYRNTQDLIESYVVVNEEDIAESTYQNIGTNNSIGINTFISKTFNKVWTVRGNVNVFTYNAESNLEDYSVTNDGLQYNFFASTSYQFKKGWKAEAFGFYRAKERTLQGEKTSFWMTSVGFQKEFWNKRASLGIRIVDPFNRSKIFRTELEDDDFYQNSEFSIPFRSFGLNFKYTFGKLDFKAKKSRSKINNDDQKGGGDGQQGGGQGGGN